MLEIIILYLCGATIVVGFLVDNGVAATKYDYMLFACKVVFWPVWAIYSVIVWWVNLPDEN